VARHLDFRHDRDVTLGGVSHDLLRLLLCVETAVGFIRATRECHVRAHRLATGPHVGELRVLLDLQPPALVVREVPVEGVELVHGHLVEQVFDFAHRLEVPARIEHEATPFEARGVDDVHARYAVACIGIGQQLPVGHRAVEQPGFVVRGDADASVADIEGIGFTTLDRRLRRQCDAATSRLAFDDVQREAARLANPSLQLPRHPPRLGIARRHHDLRARRDLEMTRRALHLRGHRDKRKRRVVDGAGCLLRRSGAGTEASGHGKKEESAHPGFLSYR